METINYNGVIERKKTVRATHLQLARPRRKIDLCGVQPWREPYSACPRRHCQHSYSATKCQPAGTVILNLTISSPQQ